MGRKKKEDTEVVSKNIYKGLDVVIFPSAIFDFRNQQHYHHTIVKLKKNKDTQMYIKFQEDLMRETEHVRFILPNDQVTFKYTMNIDLAHQFARNLKQISSFLESNIGKSNIGKEYKISFDFGCLLFTILSESGDAELSVSLKRDDLKNPNFHKVYMINSSMVLTNLRRSKEDMTDCTIQQILYHEERSSIKQRKQKDLSVLTYLVENPGKTYMTKEQIRVKIAVLNLQLAYLDKQPSYYIDERSIENDPK